MTPREYCRATLPRVSRTFAINISFLRGRLYDSILCAYLFCRIADTVEDTGFEDRRLQKKLLIQLHKMFATRNLSAPAISRWQLEFAGARKTSSCSAADLSLLENFQRVAQFYQSLPANYQQAIDDCLVEMTRGMAETIAKKRYRGQRLFFSNTVDDLNRYCYFVAGTVGILLTRLFQTHARGLHGKVLGALRERAISFGLGLQLTNIIKDCRADFDRGACYIPEELLRAHGLPPECLFDSRHRSAAMKTMNDLIRRAAGHLDDALDYTLYIPRREVRLRLFCLLPLFFAISTLSLAKDNLKLLAGERVKISRRQVRQCMHTALFFFWSNRRLTRFYRRQRAQLEAIPSGSLA